MHSLSHPISIQLLLGFFVNIAVELLADDHLIQIVITMTVVQVSNLKHKYIQSPIQVVHSFCSQFLMVTQRLMSISIEVPWEEYTRSTFISCGAEFVVRTYFKK